MAKCNKCNGSGWFNEEAQLGCFYCQVRGGKGKAGNGEERVVKPSRTEMKAERADEFADNVFNVWIERREAIKEISKRTGWTTAAVKNFLNFTMHKRFNMFVFDGDKVIAKKHLPEEQ